LRALTDALGVICEPLDDMPRAFCPLNDERLIESAAAGMLPLVIKDELYLVVRGGARVIYLFGGDAGFPARRIRQERNGRFNGRGAKASYQDAI
jgi:hypothetical protein